MMILPFKPMRFEHQIDVICRVHEMYKDLSLSIVQNFSRLPINGLQDVLGVGYSNMPRPMGISNQASMGQPVLTLCKTSPLLVSLHHPPN